ncbi:alpha/beta hydrolase [Sulfitobacter sp. LCG007]
MSLDDAYANAAYIPGAAGFPPRWKSAAQAFRADLGDRAETDRPYGDSDRQVYDIFRPEDAPRGTLIFVHGGYWKAFDHSDWSHLARGALAHGWSVALPGYDLCPAVRISDITRQIAAAVTEIAGTTEGPIALAGHSAGGHLVARMLDPEVLPEEVRSRIARVVPISPLSDLAPLMDTEMNETLRIDAAEAEAESPVNMPAPEGVGVEVWVGSDERPAFLEQADLLAGAWNVPCVTVDRKHHFDVIEALEDPEDRLVRFLCDG